MLLFKAWTHQTHSRIFARSNIGNLWATSDSSSGRKRGLEFTSMPPVLAGGLVACLAIDTFIIPARPLTSGAYERELQLKNLIEKVAKPA